MPFGYRAIVLWFNHFSSPNIHFLTGASGTNNGNSIAIDDTGFDYVAGTIDTLGDSTRFAKNHAPDYFFANSREMGYITKYKISGHTPQLTSFITIIDTISATNPCGVDSTSVFAHQTIVSNNGNVYIAGNFKGCNLLLTDANGVPQLITTSSTAHLQDQNMFLAVFDDSLSPIACHIINTDSSLSLYTADIVKGLGYSDLGEKVFFTGSVYGSYVHVEQVTQSFCWNKLK